VREVRICNLNLLFLRLWRELSLEKLTAGHPKGNLVGRYFENAFQLQLKRFTFNHPINGFDGSVFLWLVDIP